jgi:hypothetical protein
MTKETDGFYCKGKKVANLPEGSVSDYKTPEHKLEVTNEFNLSNRIWEVPYLQGVQAKEIAISAEDVKEFIRLLKERTCKSPYICGDLKRELKEIIDKLAGEKLK